MSEETSDTWSTNIEVEATGRTHTNWKDFSSHATAAISRDHLRVGDSPWPGKGGQDACELKIDPAMCMKIKVEKEKFSPREVLIVHL